MNAILAVCFLVCLVPPAFTFQYREPEPRMIVEDYPQQMVHTFLTDNRTGENLRILLVQDKYVLLGGRNAIHNVSTDAMQVVSNITWFPSSLSYANCRLHFDDDVCGNYIRVARHMSPDVLLICGTHANTPRCRVYKRSPSGGFAWKTDVDGKTVCPSHRNQTAVYHLAGSRLIAAVSGCPEWGRLPVLYANPLRTKPNDFRQLNADAQFVGFTSSNEFVYVFFRETVANDHKCGTQVVSMVARVCANDPGGPTHQYWSTFVKTKLRCVLNGTAPYNFTAIRGVSPSGFSAARNLIYAFFSTNSNPIQSSAMCVFNVADVDSVLRGNKTESEDRCLFQNVTAEHMDANPLVEGQVVNVLGEPILMHVGFNYHYTAMTVDPDIQTTNGKSFDVLFIGTNHGHVIKAVNTGINSASTVVVEDIIVFPEGEPVRELKIVRSPHAITLLVLTYHEVVSVPLDNCNWTATSCAECVGLQDPYCAWDTKRSLCDSLLLRTMTGDLVQNVTSGLSSHCPGGQQTPLMKSRTVHGKETLNRMHETADVSHLYSGQTLGLTVSFCAMVSVAIGVFTGCWCSGHRKKSLFYFNYK